MTEDELKKVVAAKPRIMKVAKKVRPRAIAKAGGSQVRGFLDFLRNQGVVGLAVGLVLGGAVSVLVKSLIDNVVMPPIGLLLGSAEGLNGLSWTVGKAGGKAAVLHYGVFLNDLVNFLVIAAVIYLIVHLLRLDKLDKKS